MQRLRKIIKHNPIVWAAALIPALVFVLTMQLHLHVHTDHQHDHDEQQHSHQSDQHTAHLGNIHNADDNQGHQHTDGETAVIDITPDGLSKYFSKVLLTLALFALLIIVLSRQSQTQWLKRLNNENPLIRWHTALPPQLRAPPR
jgi:hypothetical protein